MTAVETVAAIRAALEEAGREYRARVDDILDAVLAELSPAPSTGLVTEPHDGHKASVACPGCPHDTPKED